MHALRPQLEAHVAASILQNRASPHPERARERAPPSASASTSDSQNCDRCMRPPMWKLASPDDADALHGQHRRADGQRDRRPTEMPEAILSEMKQVRPLLGRDQAHVRLMPARRYLPSCVSVCPLCVALAPTGPGLWRPIS